MKLLKEHLENYSTITNKVAEDLGVSRQELAELTRYEKLFRIRPGLYKLKGDLLDDFVLISANSNRVLFSHETALFLHDLSDRTPNVFHISVPQGYNASHIKKRYENLQIHYVKKDLYGTGKSEIKTPMGSVVPVYNQERTICDIIKDKNNIDKEIFTDGLKRYFSKNDKNLRELVKYSRLFGIENDVRKYMEVLL